MIDCLIVIDRDGTVIEKQDYLGKGNKWKSTTVCLYWL